MFNTLQALINRSVDIKQGEGAPLFLSALYYFLLLCAYYIIRPIRDDMGAEEASRIWHGCLAAPL